MLAVALIALLGAGLGRTVLGDGLFVWLDRLAWAFVALLGLWNLAAAFGWRTMAVHAHAHAHLAIEHEHPHGAGEGHRFHHGLAWLGAFFGLGGFRGFMTLASRSGAWDFATALLLFGLGITAVFILLSWASGLLAARFGEAPGLRRALYGVSGAGNLAVGLWLLARP
jgi:cytochrome c biogenesis protein CcdA